MEINNQFAFDSEEEARKELLRAGRELEKIAINVWRKYLSSYKPKVYVRTGKSEKSIKLGSVKKLDDNTLGIELTWVNDLAYHDSIFGEGNKQGHAIMLISAGWKAKKLEKKIGRKYRLTYYEGFDYIGKVREAFESVKHRGIELEIQWSGKSTR